MQRTSERREESQGSVRVIPPLGDRPPPHDFDQFDDQDAPAPSPVLRWSALVLGVMALALAAMWTGGSESSNPESAAPPTSASLRGDEEPPDDAALTSVRDISVPIEASLASWSRARIEDVTTAVDVTVYSGRFAALTATPTGPQVVTSSSGSAWTATDRFESPPNHSGFLDVVAHKGRLIALGMVDNELVAWRSPTASTWELLEPIEDFGFAPTVVAASNGERLLLVATSTAGIVRTWTSAEGTSWDRTTGSPLLSGGTEITTATASDGWFYVGGTACVDSGCFPTVVRSIDGSRWEPVSDLDIAPAAIDDRPGRVTHLAATRDGLLAIGTVDDGVERTAVWLSTDGAGFRQAPEPTALTPPPISVRVSRVDDNEVRLTVAGAIHQLHPGEALGTPYGLVSVEEITDDDVVIATPDRTATLRAGDATAVASRTVVLGLAAEGRRIVAVGADSASGDSVPVVWASSDAGLTWERVDLPADAPALAQRVAIRGGAIAILGSDASGALAWTGQWRTEHAAFAAEKNARAFLAAITSGDSAAIVGMLSAESPPATAALPTLASIDLATRWWDEQGAISPGAVADTLEYVAALGTSLQLGECRTAVTLSATDDVAVTCDYAGTSDMIDAFGFEGDRGVARISLEDGTITGFSATGQTSSIWSALATWTTEFEPDLISSLPSAVTEDGQPALLDETTAQIHLGLIGQFRERLMLPGATRTTETPVGRVEWTWIEQPFGPGTSTSHILATSDRILAMTYSITAANEPGLWSSPDGVTWTQIPTPEADWFGEPHEFGDGLLLAGWHRNQARIWALEGDEWVEIEIEAAGEASGGGGIEILGVLDGTALVRSTVWESNGELAEQRIGLIGEDLVFEPIELPTGMLGARDEVASITVATGGPDGAAAITHDWPNPPTMWFTRDLRSWEALPPIPELANAGVSQLEYHNGFFVALAWRDDPDCREDSVGASLCYNPMEIWVGRAGGTMTRVDTIRNVESATVGFGPLGGIGLVTSPAEQDRGRIMRLIGATSTTDWQPWADPLLADPAARWMWPTGVAVGSDRIVVGFEIDRGLGDGGSFQPVATMLVGRLLDG